MSADMSVKGEKKITPIRLLLLGETGVLLLATLIHTGALIDGYQHREPASRKM